MLRNNILLQDRYNSYKYLLYNYCCQRAAFCAKRFSKWLILQKEIVYAKANLNILDSIVWKQASK